MILTPANDADLLWYFNIADIGRSSSTFGATLDRQAARYRDSSGAVIPKPSRHVNYITIKSDSPTPGTANEPSYIPDHRTSMRIAAVSRRLGTLSREHQTALELFHGYIGAEWEAAYGRSRRAYCLIPHIPSGPRWLQPLYRRYGDASPDLIARMEVADQDKNPNDIRGRQLEVLELECYKLRIAAERAYQAIPRTH